MSYRTEPPTRTASLRLLVDSDRITSTRLDADEPLRRVRGLRAAGFTDHSIAALTGLGVIDVRRLLADNAFSVPTLSRE